MGLSLCGLKFTNSTALLDIVLVSGLSFNLVQLTTLENTITYHNAVCLSTQNLA